jgi:hypothetical protein
LGAFCNSPKGFGEGVAFGADKKMKKVFLVDEYKSRILVRGRVGPPSLSDIYMKKLDRANN